MKQCFKPCEERFSAAEALNHPWLQGNRDYVISEESKTQLASALLCFSKSKPLVQLLMEVMSFTLKPAQVRELREMFYSMDTNATAEISFEQFKEYMEGYMTEGEIKTAFKALDYNGSSIITYHKFLAGAIYHDLIDEGNVSFAFEMLSRGQKSFLTVTDLVGVFRNDVKPSDIDRAYRGAGYSLQDKLDYEGFKRLIFDGLSDGSKNFKPCTIVFEELPLLSTTRSGLTEETCVPSFSVCSTARTDFTEVIGIASDSLCDTARSDLSEESNSVVSWNYSAMMSKSALEMVDET
jgi:Ca2+-binding EF-hand superfamily protein